MSANLVCSSAVHEALKADDKAWSLLPYTRSGVQLDADEDGVHALFQVRQCHCHSTLYRDFLPAVTARLALARAQSDVAMVARCRAALTGDAKALQSWRDAVEMERLMGGSR